MRACIFANGQLHDLEGAKRLIQPDDLLVAADGGAEHCRALGIVPDAIVGAIRVGFWRLSKVAQKVLSSASVIDNPSSAALLSRCAGVEGEDFFTALDELEWQRWLVADSRGYSFIAKIVKEVVARDMVTEGQKLRIIEAAEAGL